MLDYDPNKAAAATASIETGFDTTPVTATVNPAQASASATIDTGFADLDATLAPDQPAASTVNTAADAGNPEDPDAELDARVSDLLTKKPTNWSAVRAFMATVVPWPMSSKDVGWVNIHYSFPDTNVPKVGRAYKDISRFMGYVRWGLKNPDRVKDMFFCTSLQRDTRGVTKTGDPKAAKSGPAALALRSIWADIDVKPGDPKHYGTEAEALKAILRFASKVGLPTPSAIVRSGGGLHVYWINTEALPPQEWLPYAQGLKKLLNANTVLADTAITTDTARLLRIPGTLNHKPKYPQPMPVEQIDLPLNTYDFRSRLAFLHQSAGPAAAPTAAPAPHSIWANDPTVPPGAREKFESGPAAAFTMLKDEPNLNAGIDKQEGFKVDPRLIFKECGFYREALRNGGADHDQPLWNLAVYGTTFMKAGDTIAHKISSGHQSYVEADTRALFIRKAAERASSAVLGYPSCEKIAGAGCKSCATCPLLGKVKSPLNIRPEVTATVNDTGYPSGSTGQSNWTGRPGISFSNIPHRPWLYGFDLVRGELTVIGSPGGAGKSSLAIGMAICVATNRELLGEKVRGGAGLKALVINGEDSTDEIRRRVYAFCLEHNIAEQDLINLTIAGADDSWVQKVSFLKTNEKGMSTVNQDGLDALQLALDALQPDIIVLDPLVSFCAGGNMNDNSGMSLVMRNLKRIAANNRCAVIIVHHTRKGGDAGNVEAISGAAAITNLARRAIMPAPLTDADSRLGILPSERQQYFKLVDAKSNLVPRGVDAPLYRLLGVELPNPEPPLYPNGDNVQAITRVVLPTQSGANPDDMKMELAIMEVVARGKEIDGHVYPYSPSLAGASNERALLPDAMDAVSRTTAPRQWLPSDLEAVIKAAIKRMQADGRLVVEDMPKSGRFRRGRGLKAVSI